MTVGHYDASSDGSVGVFFSGSCFADPLGEAASKLKMLCHGSRLAQDPEEWRLSSLAVLAAECSHRLFVMALRIDLGS